MYSENKLCLMCAYMRVYMCACEKKFIFYLHIYIFESIFFIFKQLCNVDVSVVVIFYLHYYTTGRKLKAFLQKISTLLGEWSGFLEKNFSQSHLAVRVKMCITPLYPLLYLCIKANLL